MTLSISACTDKEAESDDSECTAPLTWYGDADGDGYGALDAPMEACAQPANAVTDSTDCDDGDAAINPGAEELCGGGDEDCDGALDDGAADAPTWYVDRDEDGFGDPNAPLVACDQLPTHVANDSDCDDANATVYPGSVEICDGLDNDCDPTTIEAGLATFIDEAGVVHDYTAILAGNEDAVSQPIFDEPGTLMVCAGIWFTNLEIAADVDIIGVGGPEEVILDGGAQASVVLVRTDGVSVNISDLALVHGEGNTEIDVYESGDSWGGAVGCLGVETPPEISFNSVLIRNNEAFGGGGIAAFTCDIRLEGSQITGNAADYGGALLMQSGNLQLIDTLIDHNSAVVSGGMLLLQSEATCTGSSTTQAGFQANTASEEPGAIEMFESSFSAAECDFGEPESEASSGVNNNQPNDIAVGSYYANRYNYGDDTTLFCEDPRCGTLTSATLGGTSGSVSSSTNHVEGNIFTVTEETTLEDFDAYLTTTTSSCSLYFYLLSAPEPTSSSWTVVRARSAYVSTASAGYVNSGSMGEILEPGLSYATVVGWTGSCTVSSGTTSTSATTDLGPATAGDYRWEPSSFDRTAYTSGVVSSGVVSTGSTHKVYPQRYNFSR